MVKGWERFTPQIDFDFGIDWDINWNLEGSLKLERLLASIALASTLSLGINGPWRWYGYTLRSLGFLSGLGFCIIHRERKAAETLEAIEARIADYQAQWEADKLETLSQIEAAEQGYLQEIDRLNQIVAAHEMQAQQYQELLTRLQQRLKDDKKYLRRIWEFKQRHPEDADKLPKIIPAVLYDWKPGARFSGTKQYNEAKQYFIELDG